MQTVDSLYEIIDRSAIAQLSHELISACNEMSKADWLELVLCGFVRAAHTTAKSKSIAIKNVTKLIQETFRRYSNNGIVGSFMEDSSHLMMLIRDLPTRTQMAISNFVKLSRETQRDEIVDLLLTWIIFWAAAGDADLEGGLPDRDLMLGIDNHRNLFSHTVLLGLESEVTLRFAIEMLDALYDHLPTKHNIAWDSCNQFIHKHKEKSICAVWAGIGAHFIKDAHLVSNATKPYVDMPISMPMRAHQTLLAVNGLACEAVAFSKFSSGYSFKGNELIEESRRSVMETERSSRLERLGAILKSIIEIMRNLKEVVYPTAELTYREVVRYFVEERPNDLRIEKGVFLVESHSQSIMTIWAFLDSSDQVLSSDKGKPYGRKLRVKCLDKELIEMLDGNSLLIIE